MGGPQRSPAAGDLGQLGQQVVERAGQRGDGQQGPRPNPLDPGQLLRGLAASVQAFGGGASIAQIGAVYMVSAAIAAASPTPGGVGAFEAVLTAGLTGIGISPGAAVSAVVVYRLATYWLPVAPGWLSWRLLQRMQYV